MCVHSLLLALLLLSPQVHRRCLYDDGRGVGEALNETGVRGDGLIVRGRYIIFIGNVQNSTYWHRMLARSLKYLPQLAFETSTDSVSDVVGKYFTQVRLTKGRLGGREGEGEGEEGG